MARSYSHISEYETEILQLREKGISVKEIGAKLGFTKEQVKNFIARYNRKQRMIKADKTSHPKGRPCKSDNILCKGWTNWPKCVMCWPVKKDISKDWKWRMN